MTEKEKQFNQWFDEYADGVKVFEEADMKQAYLQGRADLIKENTELERKLEHTEKDLADYQFNYPTIKELQKENAELKEELKKWKDEWQEQVQKATDEGYARTLQTIQLTKAKKIIKELCGMVRELNKPNVQLTNVDYSLSEAERFIKE